MRTGPSGGPRFREGACRSRKGQGCRGSAALRCSSTAAPRAVISASALHRLSAQLPAVRKLPRQYRHLPASPSPEDHADPGPWADPAATPRADESTWLLSVRSGDSPANHGALSPRRCSARMSSSVRVWPTLTTFRWKPAASKRRTSANTLMSPCVRFSMRPTVNRLSPARSANCC